MTDSVALNTGTVSPTTADAAPEWPLAAPYDVQVRDAAGRVQTGQVVTADLVLVTAEAVAAPAAVELPDGSQVLAVRIVGPEHDAEGRKIWALEFFTGTVSVRAVPAAEPEHLGHGAVRRKPLWCSIFGSRLASCR